MIRNLLATLNRSGFDNNDHNFMAFLESHSRTPALHLVSATPATAPAGDVIHKQAA